MPTTRRDVLVFGASAFALGASGCAILRGGAIHPRWKASDASLSGDTLTVPLADVRAVGEGKVLEVRLAPAHQDLLLSPRADGGVNVVAAACTHIRAPSTTTRPATTGCAPATTRASPSRASSPAGPRRRT